MKRASSAPPHDAAEHSDPRVRREQPNAPRLRRFWIFGEGRLLDFIDELNANRALRAWLALSAAEGEKLAPFEGASAVAGGCTYEAKLDEVPS